jgi:hypothetical protein
MILQFNSSTGSKNIKILKQLFNIRFMKQYRFRINEFKRMAIVNVLKSHLFACKKLWENIKDIPNKNLKKFYNIINSNEIAKEYKFPKIYHFKFIKEQEGGDGYA